MPGSSLVTDSSHLSSEHPCIRHYYTVLSLLYYSPVSKAVLALPIQIFVCVALEFSLGLGHFLTVLGFRSLYLFGGGGRAEMFRVLSVLQDKVACDHCPPP